MKDKVQNNINRIKELATTPVIAGHVRVIKSVHANDSLSKAIRSRKEADIFLAELNAAIAMSNKK